MDGSDEMFYKEKYLKYKSKYLELKQIEEQMGGFTLQDGILCFFTSDKLAAKIQEMFKGKATKLEQIKEILHNESYVIKDGERDLELVLKTKGLKKGDVPTDNKPKKVSIAGNLFNRCNQNDIKDVKSVLGAYKFKSNAMVIVRVYKTDKNRLMAVTPIDK